MGGSFHDAISDSEATLFLCRKIRSEMPDVWSSAMHFSNKKSVVAFLENEPLLAFIGFNDGELSVNVGAMVGQNTDPKKTNEYFAFNVQYDPEIYAHMEDDEIRSALLKKPNLVHVVRSNTSPILLYPEDLPEYLPKPLPSIETLEKRSNYLESNPIFKQRLVQILTSLSRKYAPSPYIEEQIYDSFFDRRNWVVTSKFHMSPWEGRLDIVPHIYDERLRKIAKRLIFTEAPHILSNEEASKYAAHIQRRLFGKGGARPPWRTVSDAIEEAQVLLTGNGNDIHRKQLSSILTHLNSVY